MLLDFFATSYYCVISPLSKSCLITLSKWGNKFFVKNPENVKNLWLTQEQNVEPIKVQIRRQFLIRSRDTLSLITPIIRRWLLTAVSDVYSFCVWTCLNFSLGILGTFALFKLPTWLWGTYLLKWKVIFLKFL